MQVELEKEKLEAGRPDWRLLQWSVTDGGGFDEGEEETARS